MTDHNVALGLRVLQKIFQRPGRTLTGSHLPIGFTTPLVVDFSKPLEHLVVQKADDASYMYAGIVHTIDTKVAVFHLVYHPLQDKIVGSSVDVRFFKDTASAEKYIDSLKHGQLVTKKPWNGFIHNLNITSSRTKSSSKTKSSKSEKR